MYHHTGSWNKHEKERKRDFASLMFSIFSSRENGSLHVSECQGDWIRKVFWYSETSTGTRAKNIKTNLKKHLLWQGWCWWMMMFHFYCLFFYQNLSQVTMLTFAMESWTLLKTEFKDTHRALSGKAIDCIVLYLIIHFRSI